MANPITAALLRFAGRLRFPQLFGIAAVLFLLDLAIPDLIPFADELLLGLLTLLLGSLRKRREPTDIEGSATRVQEARGSGREGR